MFNSIQIEQYLIQGRQAGCLRDQMENFLRAGILLQPKQLAASAAARLCDLPDGPTAVGFGGARGGGKSFWLLAQMGLDDCQRFPGLKCLLLRKVAKSNLENFDDLRRQVFRNVPHEFALSRGTLTFPNGSRIIAGHFHNERDIDAHLGLEYDVVGIEEGTTLTFRKYQDILTCLRTSKPGWRPRSYSSTNPGGIGHEWYRNTFVVPFERGTESNTRFIPATVNDNPFTNPEYKAVLASRTGWQKDAWYLGRWDIAAGQFFNTFRPEVHIIDNFDKGRAVEWLAAMDFGYTHYTVVLLGAIDSEGNLYVIDEHAERHWVPQRHAQAIKQVFARHGVSPYLRGETPWQQLMRQIPPGSGGIIPLPNGDLVGIFDPRVREAYACGRTLSRFSAGGDLFSPESTGSTIAQQYAKEGIRLRPANTNRVQGWAEILNRLGDPEAGIQPTLFIHKRCTRLLDSLPYLQHDPDRPADILKTNTNDEGIGGDDAVDALRYLVATKPNEIHQVKLRGL